MAFFKQSNVRVWKAFLTDGSPAVNNGHCNVCKEVMSFDNTYKQNKFFSSNLHRRVDRELREIIEGYCVLLSVLYYAKCGWLQNVNSLLPICYCCKMFLLFIQVNMKENKFGAIENVPSINQVMHCARRLLIVSSSKKYRVFCSGEFCFAITFANHGGSEAKFCGNVDKSFEILFSEVSDKLALYRSCGQRSNLTSNFRHFWDKPTLKHALIRVTKFNKWQTEYPLRI